MSAYVRKERERELKRSASAALKMRKARNSALRPERDEERHWNATTKTTELFDPSIKKVEVFKIPKRKVEKNKGRGKDDRAVEKKKFSAQEAIAAAIGSILHPNKQDMEEENLQNREEEKKSPPPLSPMGQALSAGVPSPRLTEVAKVFEASTSPIEEHVLRQVTGMQAPVHGVRAHYTDVQTTSREFIDEKSVRLHNGNVDYRNAGRGRVRVQEHTRAAVSPSLSPEPSHHGYGHQDVLHGHAHSTSRYPTPYVKSPASRKAASQLRVQVDATASAAAAMSAVGVNPRDQDRSIIDAQPAFKSRATPGKKQTEGVDWSRPAQLSDVGHVDLEATLNNIRMLRRVSGDGMSLGHLQDNLVSKLQEIYRTHDDAVRLLHEVDERKNSSNEVEAGSTLVDRERGSQGHHHHVEGRGAVSPRSVSPPPPTDYHNPAHNPHGSPHHLHRGVRESGEYYDATHLPPAPGHSKNYWQKKAVRYVTEEDEVVLRLQKSAAGVESGNLGQRALLLGASGKEAELDEEGCDTVMKFAGAYSATMNVPSLLATHETSSRAALGAASGGALNLFAEMRREEHAQAGMAAKPSEPVSTEGIPGALASKLREDKEEYMAEALRQRRLAAVSHFPRLDAVPYELISNCNTYFNDLHYMQEARSAAFGARGVTMKFCIDRATDMIFQEMIDSVANEVDKLLEKETELLINKV